MAQPAISLAQLAIWWMAQPAICLSQPAIWRVAHVILVSALGPKPSFFLFWGTFVQLGGLLGLCLVCLDLGLTKVVFVC